MTFKEYVKIINNLLKDNPDWGELECEPIEKWAEEPIVFPYRGDDSSSWSSSEIIYV